MALARSWSRELVRRGYVVILPDRCTSRGFPNGVCTVLASEKRAGFAAAIALSPSCTSGERVWRSASGVYPPGGPAAVTRTSRPRPRT